MSSPQLSFSRPLLMGILNLTPDSFSDGGRYATTADAVAQALAMVQEGADIIDVGGESTRPGARRVDATEQKRRVLEVVQQLHRRLGPEMPVSIDTTLSEVAAAAIEHGASIVNDISAGRDDPDMRELVADTGAYLVRMHMQGTPETMQIEPVYEDVVGEVETFLRQRAGAALAAGVRRDRLILDPGIGFGKTREHNLLLLQALSRLCALGYPLLIGVSRKRFMGSICKVQSPHELTAATCACTALGVLAGAAMFRVHDVAENRQAADVAAAIRQAGHTGA
ncbi:MAG: dihydropteroate synthase [Chromatiaceae bacterium]